MSTTNPNQRFFLRKKGTNQVFQRTVLLAERHDMEPIDETKAMDLTKRAEEANKQRASDRAAQRVSGGMQVAHGKTTQDEQGAGEIRRTAEEQAEIAKLVADGKLPPSELVDPADSEQGGEKTLEKMTRDELMAIANDMKLEIGDNFKDATIRKHIIKAREEDASEQARIASEGDKE